jgi:hypothetical protein
MRFSCRSSLNSLASVKNPVLGPSAGVAGANRARGRNLKFFSWKPYQGVPTRTKPYQAGQGTAGGGGRNEWAWALGLVEGRGCKEAFGRRGAIIYARMTGDARKRWGRGGAILFRAGALWGTGGRAGGAAVRLAGPTEPQMKRLFSCMARKAWMRETGEDCVGWVCCVEQKGGLLRRL